MEDALRRLDTLTQEEARMATAEVLRMTHAIDEAVMGVREQVLVVDDRLVSVDDKVDHVKRLSPNNNNLTPRLMIFVGDQLRWDIQRWLSPPDPSTNHDFVRRARHSGSAAWFFESDVLTEWKASGSLLWIHGKRKFSCNP